MVRVLYNNNENPLYSNYNLLKKYKNTYTKNNIGDIFVKMLEVGNLFTFIFTYFYIFKVFDENNKIRCDIFVKYCNFILFIILFYTIASSNLLLKLCNKLLITIFSYCIEFVLSVICCELFNEIEFDSVIIISILSIIIYLIIGDYLLRSLIHTKLNN